MHWVAIPSIIRQAVFAVGVFLWISNPDQIGVVALIELVAVGAVVVFNLTVFRHCFGMPQLQLQIRFGRLLILQAMPIFLSQLMMALKLHLPTIILAILMSNQEVGWFRSAHRIVFALNTFVALYLFNLLPSIARSSHQNTEALDRLMHSSMQISAWSSIFVGVIGTSFAVPLISSVFGSQYSEAAQVLQIMIWFIAISLLSGHYRYILIGSGKQKWDLMSTAAGAGISVLLSLLLIPKYGMLGAAWTMLFAETLTWGLAYFYVRRSVALIPLFRHLPKPLVAGGAILAALQFLPQLDHWAKGSAAVAIYLAVLFLLQPTILTEVRSLGVGNR
jgi:O-antigen/teichoic acid export membrane protein